MSTEMTRDDLLTLMRAWGWTLTGSLPNGRADLWAHPGGMDEVVLPNDEQAPDYGRLLRGAEGTVARAEGPRLLGVVREVAALHRPVPDGLGFIDGGYDTVSPACPTCGKHDEYAVPWPCPTARAVALTETTEGGEGA